MKIITEITEEIEVFTEETSVGRQYYIEGVFLQGNLKNRNGRVYPIDVLGEEVNRYTNEFVTQNRAFGELGHPEGPTINLERVSHMIKELRQDGNNFYGRAKIMDTPYGKIVKNLIDEGARLAVSSRGLGSLQDRNGVNYVNRDFRLATAADIVADPSAPDAFVRGIMESAEWVWENGVLVAREVENYKNQIRNASQRKVEETKLKVFEDFMKKLSQNS